LGASDYVWRSLSEHLHWLKDKKTACLGKAEVVKHNRPQIAVSYGLVLSKMRNLIGCEIAPASFGVVVDKLYDPSLHYGQTVLRSRHDRKDYAKDQIEWVITKNSRVQSGHPAVHKMEKMSDLPDRIVLSHCDPAYLPRNMKQGTSSLLILASSLHMLTFLSICSGR
jgi:hypothetical protein